MENQSGSDDCDEEETLLLSLLYRGRSRRRRSRSVWVRAIFAKRQQQGEGEYGNLLQEMRLSDPQSHFQYVRVSKEKFDLLHSLVGPLLRKRHYFSRQRTEITPAE